MSKSWIRCSREIRSLTNELNQMKRELEILRWFVAGVIILLSLLFIWMIRTRRSQSNGRTDSTSGTESPVMSPRCEAENSCVRVSNAGPRRHVNGSHPLLPGYNTVSVYFTCLDCRHHAKWTHRTGPTFQQSPELQRLVQAWWAKLQRRQG